ncbi:histone-fold-containing protein [Wallemia mellicola CBS 633.66]|uniref:Histone-fold-containing protein n=2 Tax=Wallemia mellicola TaxID=1708541 RepID=A0A4V4MRU7_9BASI|nr:histone-fold-containing protein [Wallemia mellicola CBS 633.66]TIB95914.1 histone-fold-containing protein [Wallemia mellicola]EIM22057.1 histone-fold-containing protein [Wallemia mellicola CBS 633.66]TIB98930.1 histone-fold-containing protein [Wallemia mellicola]TIC19483.1 histone-fold-containing protein [Wallemia mellicola]TIC42129.1 histone-fold-containing protein [Wallemia mellicola]|eukprot:XP_006957861.1 histone-fold-containing protein [Wallemia mellicola CBS 633.66]
MSTSQTLIKSGQSLDDFLSTFWTSHLHQIEDEVTDFKKHELPLARIKKVMKSDPGVKMISAEAPILFSRACEIFISELTCRSWLVAESNKRRTLQKSDVSGAVELSDQFDFLIDIVPRSDESKKKGKNNAVESGNIQHQTYADDEAPVNDLQEVDQDEVSEGHFQQPLNYNEQQTNPANAAYLPYESDFLLNMIGSSPSHNQKPDNASEGSASDDASV